MKKNLLTFIAMLGLGTAAFAQCPSGETEVTMTVTTDAYGSETTWSITGPGGNPSYATGGPYTDQSSSGAFPQTPVTFCVPDGSTIYITVNDQYGDGMCCAYGNGAWAVSVGGTDVSTGGSFADQETATVTLGTDLGISMSDIAAVIAQGSTTVSGSVKNNGIASITGFDLSYAVDNGTPVQQSFSNTIAPGATGSFSFTTPWNATVGGHTIDYVLSGVSGDAVAANDMYSQDVEVATQSVQRVTLVEEFTSSTCNPCASFNSTFDPTLVSLNTNQPGSNIAAVKYQMDWPSPGNDPSYNSDGSSRRGYYDVSGIPSPWLDGSEMIYGNAAELNDAAAKAAFMDINLDVTRNGMEITADVEVTPYANFSGTHKLHIVAVEEYYDYVASTTSQDEYHFAERKMLPSASGTTLSSLTAGAAQSVSKSYTFTETPSGDPSQGSYDLWESLNGVIVVAFVQNNSTKEVIQAAFKKVPFVQGIAELPSNVDGMILYPNPTSNNTTLRMEMNAADRGTVRIFNALGAVVYSHNIGNLNVGTNNLVLNTDQLASGLYTVSIELENGRATRMLSVQK
ncbi:MAG: T9SS type A sorting domain-containing protein [Flavobacteriales bacterium]|nr:T9SS type A sorting domain-containing protein [Flavobacteriales bacterium]